jgi:hypothetical protein
MDFCIDLNGGQKNLVISVSQTPDYATKKTFSMRLIRLCNEIIRDYEFNPIWIEDWDRVEGHVLNPFMRIAVEGTVRFDSNEKNLFEKIKYNELIFYDDMVALDIIFGRWEADMVILN